MPLYFHLESHLWIFYLFIVNGLLIHSLLRYWSSLRTSNYLQMTNSFEAGLLAGFFISLLLNGLLLFVLDLFSQNFNWLKGILPIITIGLLCMIFKSGYFQIVTQSKVDFDWQRLLIYSFVFIILFYNGGLIEQTADSWWHMSLANKIGLASSYSLELGHLTGEPTRYYPPLWHANLAMANVISGESIPILWNSFTAWGGALKVMGFYLFTLALSANRNVSILSAVLFILLPGMGDSYLRVSAWPSHIAYTAMFCMFYVAFWMLSNYKSQQQETLSLRSYIGLQRSSLITLFFLAMTVLFVHQLELLWFFVGMVVYLAGETLYEFYKSSKINSVSRSNDLIRTVTAFFLLISLIVSIYALISDWQQMLVNIDWLLICIVTIGLIVLLMLMLFCMQGNRGSHVVRISILAITSVLSLSLLFSIDFKQLISLVNPAMAHPPPISHERPLLITGFFGGELKLPSWNLQLRSSLLYSGAVSILLSVVLVLLKPSRLTLFVCSNAVIAFLFCVSPYLYFWLASLLNYHSPWRIAILIFHPIIIAFTLNLVWEKIVGPSKI